MIWIIGDPSCTVFTPWGESLNGPADDSQDIAERLHKVHEQGPCLRCAHYACPCCGDWCDLIECQCFEAHDAACIYSTTDAAKLYSKMRIDRVVLRASFTQQDEADYGAAMDLLWEQMTDEEKAAVEDSHVSQARL